MKDLAGLVLWGMLLCGQNIVAESLPVHLGVGASLMALTPSSDLSTALQLGLGNVASLDLSLRLEDQLEIVVPLSLQRMAIEARWAPTMGSYWPYIGLGYGFFAYPQVDNSQKQFRGLYYLGCGCLRFGPSSLAGPNGGWIIDLLSVRFGPFLFFQEDLGATCLYGRDQMLAIGVVGGSYFF